MPLNDIGPYGYTEGIGVATLSQTPLNDRANIVTDILIDKVSAGDVWRVFCAGKELAAFDIQTTGNQQPLAGPFSGYPKNNHLFDIARELLNTPITFPIPNGQTLKVVSDGGATANITIEYQEVTPPEVTPGMANHPSGNRLIIPLVGYRLAAVTATGERKLDTQVGPLWVPNIFVDNNLPSNWTVKVLAMFLEGGGRNTFSGAADHQSVTSYFAAKKNGQTLYTRADLGGIPLIGKASAAGSANTVVDTDMTPFPAFQETNWFDTGSMRSPLTLGQGDSYQFRLNITGDITGNADFSLMRQLFICDIRNPGV